MTTEKFTGEKCTYAKRDALDILSTIRNLLNKKVNVNIYGLGLIGKGVGELIIAVLTQIPKWRNKKF